MHSSADQRETAQRDVVETIIALERSCLGADAAIVERRWSDLDAVFADQQALTDRLAALFAAAPEVAPDRDPRVMRRLRGVLSYRDDQLRRLRAYHDGVAERLRSLERMRRFSRSIGTHVMPARVLDAKT